MRWALVSDRPHQPAMVELDSGGIFKDVNGYVIRDPLASHLRKRVIYQSSV